MNAPESNTKPRRRKLTLTEWAEIGEVIGMVAVVISLLVLVYSINQNTIALRGATDNLLFELHAEWQSAIVQDPTLAAVRVKKELDPDAELTETESMRWTAHRHNLIDLWALAYSRYVEGLMPEEAWQAWNTYFVHRFGAQAEQLQRSEWEDWSWGWSPDFWQFVGESLGFVEG